MLKKLLLSLGALALSASLAAAQVNVVPQQGVLSANIRVATYTATAIGLVPASSATDIACIAASSTKTVSVKQITISGIAGTAVTTPFVVLRRAALDTGGTAASGVALPVAKPMNSTNAAASATVIAYTANPTINDSSPSYLRTAVLGLPTSAATLAQVLNYSFGTNVEEYDQSGDLVKGTTQQICINLQAASVSSGSLHITFEWTEQ